jgi:hypothetical protein
MADDRVSLCHFAFVTPVQWIRAAEAALAQFATSEDGSVLSEVLARWGEEVDSERMRARVDPSENEWSEIAEALERARMPRVGTPRTVFRSPWETFGRSLRRLSRLEELNGPEIIIQNERDLIQYLVSAVDSPRDPVGSRPTWDNIPSADDGEVLDLSQFGWEVAQLASGAFPKSIGQGNHVERELSAQAAERLQDVARLDDSWRIHGTHIWESGFHASYVVDDPELWAPRSVRGQRALEIPAVGASRTCNAWRALMPSVPVGDRGGPMFVREQPGDGTDFWPAHLLPGDCVVSFVLVQTPESTPFLVSDEA